MIIGVINSGSSSLKFKLFNDGVVVQNIIVQNIGRDNSAISYGSSKSNLQNISNHKEALMAIFNSIELESIEILAHRVVHGGEFFIEPTIIDDLVIEKLKSLKNLNPLHNEINLSGILLVRALNPRLKQIALFDTAFHFTIPEEAYLYAINPEYYTKYKIRKYGFHGLSHSYLTKATAKFLQKSVEDLNIITLHLGNGSSACAIKNGKSIDTSMGFTPLEGLVMGSRCGDIDAGVIFYMQRELGLSIDEVENILNKSSGMVALAGTNDMRKVNDELSLNVFTRRIKKYIGAYIALLGRVDAIIFSGGIGENSPIIRDKTIDNFAFDIKIDDEKNIKNETIISTTKSSVKILVIPTDEELEIIKQIEENPRFKVL